MATSFQLFIIQIITISVQNSVANYNGILGFLQNYPGQGPNYYPYIRDYFESSKDTIPKLRRHRKKIYRISEEFPNNFNGKYDNYNYGDFECKCSCRNCAKLKPCCEKQCTECQTQGNAPNVVIVPYPLPVVISLPSSLQPPLNNPEATTTTTTPTSTTPVTTTNIATEITRKETDITTKHSQTLSTKFPGYKKLNYCSSIANCRHYEKRQLNNYQRFLSNRYESYDKIGIRPTIPILDFANNAKSVRRTRQEWLPEYFVPINDNLAIDFGSEIRNYE